MNDKKSFEVREPTPKTIATKPVDKGFYVYFDAVMLAPREYKDAELCFCVQRNG